MKLGIVTDSTSDIPAYLIEQHELEVIPSLVVIDGQEYTDGIGITREEPGYYISQPVMQDGRVIGVTVVKLNLEWFGRASHDASEPVMVADENGVTVRESPEFAKFVIP